MKQHRFFASLRITVVLAALLVIGNNALAQTFTVEASYNSNTKKTTFTITRSGSSLPVQTINYRTVNLSAYAGQHYTAVSDSYTFPANETTKTVVVSESAASTNYYQYQTSSTNRTYRFEVLDQWGFNLASCNRTVSTGTSVPSSGLFNEKEITIYTDELQYSDAGYDKNTNNPHYINSSSYYNLSGIAPSAYYTLIGAQLRSTLSFDAREEQNGYQYVQILINNTSTCDDRKNCNDGNPGNISLSRYMAGFDHQPSSANTTYATYTFPVTSQPDNNQNPVDNAWDNGVTNKLYKQKFNTNCRATDGRLILPVDFEKLVVRFNASGGSDADKWWAKNVKAHIQAVDGTVPTIVSIDAITVSAGSYNRGNEFYISVPFREIVNISGTTKKLTTEWGDAIYESGSGTNVLTFKGTINRISGTTLAITGFEGTIADLAGNSFSGSLNKTFSGVTSSDPSYTINYTYNGGSAISSNPTSYKWSSDDITLNTPYKTGYWFDGWTGSNGSELASSVIIPSHSHGDKTYTAHWTQVWTGSGTSGDPYEITTGQGLNLLAMYVNGLSGNAKHDCSGVYFQLGENIIYTHGDNVSENNFTRIGTNSEPFCGVFNGQGHTISGIRIYKSGEVSDHNYHGLFGKIGDGGIVRNVIMTDARITGYNYVGGIAGALSTNGTIEDCIVADDVTIRAIRIDSDYHGGIVGNTQGNVSRCISRATITASNTNQCEYYGAITGISQGVISDCLAIGASVPVVSYVGALIGSNNSDSLPRNYYSSCTVEGVENAKNVGVGYETGNTSPHDISSYSQCARLIYPIALPDGVSLVRSASATLPGTGNATYDTGADIDGTPYAFYGASLTLSYAGAAMAEGYSIALYVNGIQATDNGDGTYTFTMPDANATITTGNIITPWAGKGTEAEPWQIQYPTQLDLLDSNVKSGEAYSNKYFELANDLIYDGTENNYHPIGSQTRPFSGTFNGNNHTISGICINSNSKYIGLFSRVYNGTVKNVVLSGAVITGINRVGCLVGHINGNATIENCLVLNSNVTGTDQQESYAGVIVGQKEGSSVTISHNYYFNCNVNSSASNVGVGSPAGDIIDGAVQVFSITLGPAISAIATATVTHQGTAYYSAGTTVILSGTGSAPSGYQEPFLGYSLNGADLGENVNTFEMPAADATVTARWTVVDFETGHAGTEADPYIITNKEQLDLLATRVNGGTNYSGKFIKLVADIEYDPDNLDANGKNYTPIGGYYESTIRSFSGSFDGDGHTVSGIRISKTGSTNSDSRKGLFGDITNAVIKNLTVSDTRITAHSYLGGIVGMNSGGTVENCLATSSVIITSDGQDSGGIVGDNTDSGTIRGCISSATINASEGSLSGVIAGYNDSQSIIEHCLAIGTSVSVAGSFGQQRGGAIVGCNYFDKSNNSYCAILNHNYYYGCTVTIGSKSYTNNTGVGNLANGTFSCTDVNSATILANDYTDCAVGTVTSTTKPAEICAQIVSYSNGLTVYEHGAYYNGTYYLRNDLAGQPSPLSLVQGTKNGVSAYWGTFFNGTTNYELSEGASAYTLGADHKLYRLGTNGRTIPKGVAAVIIATSADASIVPAGTGDLSITDHATGGNQLQGSDTDVAVGGLSGTPYVLSRDGSTIGFRQYTGSEIPAGKAYYVVVAP